MVKRIIQLVVFSVTSLAITGWLYVTIAEVDFEESYELSATFSDVAGLSSGDDVKVAGIPVGEVAGVDVVAGAAVVRIELDRDVDVPIDSTAVVRWRNLIGERYLAIEPGSSPRMAGGGDTLESTRSVVDLGALVNQLSPLARSVSPDDFNAILTALLQAFEGNAANFDAILANVDTILGGIADRSDTISQLLNDLSKLGGALASRDAQFETMLDNLVAISETFAAHDDLLDRSLGDIAGFSERLSGFLTKTESDFGAGLESMAVLLGTAADNVTELETSLRNLPGLFAELLPAVNRGEYLRVSVLCSTFQPGQCPWPMGISDADGGLIIAPRNGEGVTIPGGGG